MTRPLTGLSGLAGYQQQIDEDSQATPEERMGGIADPSHGKYLAEPTIPRGSRIGTPVGPYGPENQLLADEGWFWEAGGEATQDPFIDLTPSKRAGPFPKGILSGPVGSNGPDDIAAHLEQSYRLHSTNTNAQTRAQTERAFIQNDEWQTVDQLNPGHTELSNVPGQAKSSGYGWGTRDRTQSFARQNEYGFDSAHQFRRFATGPIPGNTMWMKPGGRPLAKSLPGPARPAIGENSPFTGQDLGQAFSVDGAILQNVPSEYVAPPNPQLSNGQVAGPTGDDAFPEWY